MTDPINQAIQRAEEAANALMWGVSQISNSPPAPSSIAEALRSINNSNADLSQRDLEPRSLPPMNTGFMSISLPTEIEDYITCTVILDRIEDELLKREVKLVLAGELNDLGNLLESLIPEKEDPSDRKKALLEIDLFVKKQKETNPARAATYPEYPRHLVEDLADAGMLNEYYLRGIIELGRVTGIEALSNFSEEEIASLLERSEKARS